MASVYVIQRKAQGLGNHAPMDRQQSHNGLEVFSSVEIQITRET